MIAQSGCTTTVNLPICRQLSEVSYDSLEQGKGKILGKNLADSVLKRNIRVTPLSSYKAEYTGWHKDIRWLRDNYVDLLIDFNPELVIFDEETYQSARNHSVDWIRLVEQGKDSELMSDKYGYCPLCCSAPEFPFKLRKAH